MFDIAPCSFGPAPVGFLRKAGPLGALTGQLLNLGAKDCDAVMELLVLVVGGSALTELAARPLLATIGSTTKLGSDAVDNYNSTFTEASYTKYRTFPPKGASFPGALTANSSRTL